MYAGDFFELDPIIVGNRKIYPISKLDLIVLKDLFYNIQYTVVAIKIIEDDDVYFENISLNSLEFDDLKKVMMKKNKD